MGTEGNVRRAMADLATLDRRTLRGALAGPSGGRDTTQQRPAPAVVTHGTRAATLVVARWRRAPGRAPACAASRPRLARGVRAAGRRGRSVLARRPDLERHHQHAVVLHHGLRLLDDALRDARLGADLGRAAEADELHPLVGRVPAAEARREEVGEAVPPGAAPEDAEALVLGGGPLA